MAERRITVDALARVEGEGALDIRIGPAGVERVALRIFEAPRYFEALLKGRDAAEAPEITARICGICPVAYIMSASQAVEAAWGVTITPEIAALRRLIYCGEWIQSHVLHAAMLHAPDFLGLPDAVSMARDHPELVRDALRLKKLGNALMAAVGGRATHPVNTRIGGFFRAPEAETLSALVPELEWGIDAARRMALAFADFDFPAREMDYRFVSLVHPRLYPILEGRIGSSDGLDVPVAAFAGEIEETQAPHSTALHARMRDGAPYLVGPLARYANNVERLTETCRETAAAAGLGPVERNPFRSILVRMVEVQYACEEALRLIRAYAAPDPPHVPATPAAGVGCGATEAPRGLCWHRYAIGADGRIEAARIVPPTAQNQARIEADLAAVAADHLALPDDALRALCERAIRNHDPCISCATHFLTLRVERV
jgi:coenzyme F420-reducing hydrogenase alpha subunit